ncbi:MAG: CoA ester lyase [Herpetosiphonaceae bacterium]|nr:CoA ester lyase [Herpetosiphonaceae bacterium]
MRPHRSILTVPGSSPRFMAKAAGSSADVIMLDLEDSVADSQRAAARRAIVKALHELQWGTKVRTVRVSATSTPWFYRDLITVVEGAGEHIDAIVLPKVTCAGDVYMLDTLLTQIEAVMQLRLRIGIEAQIETAPAMRDVDAIAQASPRLIALVFGPGDFAAAMGMPLLSIGADGAGYPGHIWHAHLSRMLLAARAVGVLAIDGPYAVLGDAEGLRHSAGASRRLGYDGKWAIHPAQIEMINAVFSPTVAEIEQATRIVAAYEAATAAGSGAMRSGGEMLDAASVAMARRLLSRRVDQGEPPTGGG